MLRTRRCRGTGERHTCLSDMFHIPCLGRRPGRRAPFSEASAKEKAEASENRPPHTRPTERPGRRPLDSARGKLGPAPRVRFFPLPTAQDSRRASSEGHGRRRDSVSASLRAGLRCTQDDRCPAGRGPPPLLSCDARSSCPRVSLIPQLPASHLAEMSFDRSSSSTRRPSRPQAELAPRFSPPPSPAGRPAAPSFRPRLHSAVAHESVL